jgi:hypothetical protein
MLDSHRHLMIRERLSQHLRQNPFPPAQQQQREGKQEQAGERLEKKSNN